MTAGRDVEVLYLRDDSTNHPLAPPEDVDLRDYRVCEVIHVPAGVQDYMNLIYKHMQEESKVHVSDWRPMRRGDIIRDGGRLYYMHSEGWVCVQRRALSAYELLG